MILDILLKNLMVNYSYLIVDSGGPVVIMLATGSEVQGLKLGWGRRIFSEHKNPKYDFL